MTVLYAALIFSTVVLVAVGLGLLMRLRRLSRATEAQFRRSVRDEDTAAKGGSSSYQ